MNVTPNPQLIAIARLAENLALKVKQTYQHLAEERRLIDGYPSGGSADGGSRSTDGTTSVESAVTKLDAINQLDWQVSEEIRAFASCANDLNDTCDRILRHRAQDPRTPKPDNRCTANSDYAGYRTPLAEGGWQDPLCTGVARSGATYSLCDKCRKRLTRWRERNGQKELTDERVVTHDSDYYIDDNGVAHITPIRGAA